VKEGGGESEGRRGGQYCISKKPKMWHYKLTYIEQLTNIFQKSHLNIALCVYAKRRKKYGK
jgi:hypothetical protein